MPDITIHVPGDVYKHFLREARTHKRSLEDEVRETIIRRVNLLCAAHHGFGLDRLRPTNDERLFVLMNESEALRARSWGERLRKQSDHARAHLIE